MKTIGNLFGTMAIACLLWLAFQLARVMLQIED